MSSSLLPCILIVLGMLVGCTATNPELRDPEIRRSASGYPVIRNLGPAAWPDTTGWKLVEEPLPTSADDAMSELANPTSIWLASGGTIYVNDPWQAMILVLDPDGRPRQLMHHPGEGPGEFRTLVMALRHDTIIAHDPRLSRTSLLDTMGTLLTTWPSPCCNFAAVVAESGGGVLIPGEVGRREEADAQGVFGAFGWVRYDPAGHVRDTLYTPPDLQLPMWHYTEGPQRQHSVATIPWSPRRIRLRTESGVMLQGATNHYRLVVSRADRDTIRVIDREAPAVVIPDSLRRRAVSSLVARIPALAGIATVDDVPTSYPAFDRPWPASDGTLWVPVPFDGHPAARFDVFDSTGRLLGQVPDPLPTARSWRFTNSVAFAIDPSGELGPVLRRFVITRP